MAFEAFAEKTTPIKRAVLEADAGLYTHVIDTLQDSTCAQPHNNANLPLPDLPA